MEKYIIVEDKKGNLSIVSNQEYQKENVNRLKWDAISGSDEMEDAIMVTLGRNVKLMKCKNTDGDVSK